MAKPGLLYWKPAPGVNSNGVWSREIVNGSLGGANRFQKSPFQPVNLSWAKPPSSASARPEVRDPKCRSVIFAFPGSAVHWGTYLLARSSSARRPSLSATATDKPPTSALAIEAVKCLVVALEPEAYRSKTLLSLRMMRKAVVRRA